MNPVAKGVTLAVVAVLGIRALGADMELDGAGTGKGKMALCAVWIAGVAVAALLILSA